MERSRKFPLTFVLLHITAIVLMTPVFVTIPAIFTAPTLFTMASSFDFDATPSRDRSASTRTVPQGMALDLPILFEENQGQAMPEVRYLARGKGYLFLLTMKEAIWSLQGGNDSSPAHPVKPGEAGLRNSEVVTLRLEGMNPEAQITPEETTITRTSYLKGNDPSNWKTGIANHRRVRYQEIYPGIDLLFYGNQGRMEYDFRLSPGADPEQIQLSFSGAKGIRIAPEGDLILETQAGELRHLAPYTYQEIEGEKLQIAGRFRLQDEGLVAFEVEPYDRTLALTIDPVLVYSTYLGGGKDETPGGVTADSEGNLYVIGSTGSTDFPIHDPLQDEFAGGGSPLGDVFVTKIDKSGSSIVYSTFIGGAGTDLGTDIAVDSMGRVVATGTTFSGDFPSTQGSFQPACSGFCPFVFQLSADGSQLNYGTFIGRGHGLAIALDNLEQPVLTGSTASADFPVKNAFQSEKPGMNEAFVTKLNAEGSDLIFSTYLGGSDVDNLIGTAGIDTDAAGNIYVTGRTESDDFPTLNPIQPTLQGENDAFVSKFNPQGGLVYSTYLGGTEDDVGNGLCAEEDGTVYLTGNTKSLDFPTHMAFQPDYGGGTAVGDAFVAKIAPSGGVFVYSTYLGGQLGDTGIDIAVDGLGQAVVVGTGGSNFPVRQPLREFDGLDAYVTKLTADGSDLVYSTPIGNGDNDIAVTTFGTDVYVAGENSTANSPILNALQPRSNGFAEIFLNHISDTGSIYFAQFGNGEGAISDILLTNSSPAAPSSATVSFKDDDGTPVSIGVTVTGDVVAGTFQETSSDLDVTVAPLGSVKITTDGIGDIVTGSVTVTFDMPLGGVIRFDLGASGIAGVNQSTLVRGFITPVRKTSVNTGIAIHNPEDRQVGLTMRLRNLAGEEIQGGLKSLALDPGGHLAQFITELFPNADLSNFEGTLTVEVGTFNALIAATALELGAKPGEFTTLPVTPLP